MITLSYYIHFSIREPPREQYAEIWSKPSLIQDALPLTQDCTKGYLNSPSNNLDGIPRPVWTPQPYSSWTPLPMAAPHLPHQKPVLLLHLTLPVSVSELNLSFHFSHFHYTSSFSPLRPFHQARPLTSLNQGWLLQLLSLHHLAVHMYIIRPSIRPSIHPCMHSNASTDALGKGIHQGTSKN